MTSLRTRRDFLKLSAAGVGLALAACAPATEAPAGEAGAAAGEGEAQINLVAWFADRRTINAMTEEVMAKEFQERNPNIQVDVVFVPEGEIPAKMTTSFAGGNAPDITAIDETYLSAFMSQDFVHAIPREIMDVEAEMGKRVADFYAVDGEFYCLPNGNMPNSLFYNQDVLDAKGYTVDDIPGQWDEFIQWAKELTVGEGEDITEWGFTFTGAPYIWDSILYQQGGFMFYNAKECAFDDQRATAAWELVRDMIEVHQIETPFAPTSPQDRVGQGLAATGTNFAFASGFLVNEYPDTNWGTTTYPTLTGEPPYVRSSDDLGFCMTSQQEDPGAIDATWTLWRYLLSPDYQRRYVVLRGVQPSLLEIQGESEFTVDNPRWAGIAVHTQPGNFRTDGIWPIEAITLMWPDSWERIINQKEAIPEVLVDHKAKIDQILADLDLPFLFGAEGWQEEWDQPV